ncbi:MAG: hypothetical protein PHU25_06365 [Deltaproteobacteria bacterium]|nr:hypothetical protein [Deltaproteobacteria bacterium]
MSGRAKSLVHLAASSLALLALVSPSFARAGGNDDGLALRSAADVGFVMMDEDGFVLARLTQDLFWDGLELTLSAPLRLRVLNRAPDDDGVIREQDWDEASDFARIVPRARFARAWEDAEVVALFGEENGVSVGHGSVADLYFNSLDMDHYQGGLVLKGQGAGNGLEFLMDNVVEPEILVGRGFVAPLAWFLGGSWPRRLELGYTLGADIAAPRHLTASGPTALVVTGGDISLRVVDMEWLRLTPYLDVNVMDGEAGVHLGVSSWWRLSEEPRVSLLAKGEYRHLGSDYHPAVFNPFYDRMRRCYGTDPDTGETPTFADHLASSEDPVSDAFMFDVGLVWEEHLKLGARYDREGQGRPHWVMFRLDVEPWDDVNLAGFYAGEDTRGGSGLFSYDALIGAEARGKVWGPLYLFAELTRMWRRMDGDVPFANEAGGGIGLVMVY